jgi:HAD superfamily hydrolase (TIGR01459 family)
VLHDGGKAYPGAIDCLKQMKAAGKGVALLSNAPRPAAGIELVLQDLGFPPAIYDALMTSGQEVWQNLKRRTDPWYAALGQRCYLLGLFKDTPMLEGVDVVQVDRIEDADFILNTGADFGETVADYAEFLAKAAGLNLPMICANPDLVVIHHGVREICAGALAVEYEALGGTVRYHGKPHPSVYHECFRLLGLTDLGRIAAFGDALATDMAGAKSVGIDAYFVTGGIHAAEIGPLEDARAGAVIAQLCGNAGVEPKGALPGLMW